MFIITSKTGQKFNADDKDQETYNAMMEKQLPQVARLTLQGMSDETYSAVLNETVDIQYLIMASGGMAKKTAVENILMSRHLLDRSDAHTFTNCAESRRYFMVRSGKVEWLAKRPEPKIEDYPELAQSLKEAAILNQWPIEIQWKSPWPLSELELVKFYRSGIGAYPYDCIASRHHPDAVIYRENPDGTGGWLCSSNLEEIRPGVYRSKV